jgi:hypothetical protein
MPNIPQLRTLATTPIFFEAPKNDPASPRLLEGGETGARQKLAARKLPAANTPARLCAVRTATGFD